MKKNWWKMLTLAVVATVINIVSHIIDGTQLWTNIDPLSILSQTIGMRSVVVIFFIVFFFSLSVTFLTIEKWLSGGKIVKGLKFGVSWGIVFFLGAVETYPVFGKSSILSDFRLGLVDLFSVVVLGLLLGRFFASDSPSGKAQSRNDGVILSIVTLIYVIGRYLSYSLLNIESGWVERPVSTLIWTMSAGISFGILYVLAGRNMSEANLVKRSVSFGLMNVGTNWLIFNLFWPLVYQSSVSRFAEFAVGRAVLDTIFIILGVYFSERLVNRKVGRKVGRKVEMVSDPAVVRR